MNTFTETILANKNHDKTKSSDEKTYFVVFKKSFLATQHKSL